MKTATRINSELARSTRRTRGQGCKHKLPLCDATGLARYRDRHQARHGAKAMSAGEHNIETSTFACPSCRGFHIETTYYREPIAVGAVVVPTDAYIASLATRKRRYIVFDPENPTRGAKATCEELAGFWNVLKQQAPGIAPHDHVVVGAARYVVRKYRSAIDGPNVKWVVGADAPDGADHALLAAVDLRRVARKFDELLIISGDGIFANLARRAKSLGLTVHVVTAQHPSQHSMLSRDLAAVADVRTLVRLDSRPQKRDNLTAIDKGEGRMHRRAEHVAA